MDLTARIKRENESAWIEPAARWLDTWAKYYGEQGKKCRESDPDGAHDAFATAGLIHLLAVKLRSGEIEPPVESAEDE